MGIRFNLNSEIPGTVNSITISDSGSTTIHFLPVTEDPNLGERYKAAFGQKPHFVLGENSISFTLYPVNKNSVSRIISTLNSQGFLTEQDFVLISNQIDRSFSNDQSNYR
jgi:hypothetical protein